MLIALSYGSPNEFAGSATDPVPQSEAFFVPTICVDSPDSDDESHHRGGPELAAAALMAKMLANASRPIAHPTKRQKRIRAEPTRPGNPNRLTVNQHVFPTYSIKRFANKSGLVSVHDILRGKSFPATPKNKIFCAIRAWDERAEAGYMKKIEDRFQSIVDPVIDNKKITIAREEKAEIDDMFSLWYIRARYHVLDQQEYQLNGISGENLSKEQEENLEKNSYLFARKGGMMPARQLNGVELQMRIASYSRDLNAITKWGIIRAQSGHFLVPDVPCHTIIPLSPTVALAADISDGFVTLENLTEINRALKFGSCDYYFSLNLSKCPI